MENSENDNVRDQLKDEEAHDVNGGSGDLLKLSGTGSDEKMEERFGPPIVFPPPGSPGS